MDETRTWTDRRLNVAPWKGVRKPIITEEGYVRVIISTGANTDTPDRHSAIVKSGVEVVLCLVAKGRCGLVNTVRFTTNAGDLSGLLVKPNVELFEVVMSRTF